jgi:large subunit ribosomal protein L29
MEPSELRQFTVDELKGRILQWKEELFRARFKAQTSEAKDTSVLGKLRKDIARANTVLVEKEKGIVLPASASVVKTKAAKAPKESKEAKESKKDEDKPAKTKKKAKGE